MPLSSEDEKLLVELEQRLAARCDSGGQPKPGYKGNVAAMNAKIAQLKKARGDSFQITSL